MPRKGRGRRTKKQAARIKLTKERHGPDAFKNWGKLGGQPTHKKTNE